MRLLPALLVLCTVGCAAPLTSPAQGLAQYFETLRLEGDHLVLGETGALDFSERPVPWVSHRAAGDTDTTQIPAFKAPRVWDLLYADWTTFHSATAIEDPTRAQREQESTNYAAAWKLVHYPAARARLRRCRPPAPS